MQSFNKFIFLKINNIIFCPYFLKCLNIIYCLKMENSHLFNNKDNNNSNWCNVDIIVIGFTHVRYLF